MGDFPKGKEESAPDINGLLRRIIMGLQGGSADANNWGDWTLPTTRSDGGNVLDKKGQQDLLAQLNAHLGEVGLQTLQRPLDGVAGSSTDVISDWTFPTGSKDGGKSKGEFIMQIKDELAALSGTARNSKDLQVKECWTPETFVAQKNINDMPRDDSNSDMIRSIALKAPTSTISLLTWPQRRITGRLASAQDNMRNWWKSSQSGWDKGDTASIVSSPASFGDTQWDKESGTKRRCLRARFGPWSMFFIGMVTGALLVLLSLMYLELGSSDDALYASPVSAGLVAPQSQVQDKYWEEMYRNSSNRVSDLERQVKIYKNVQAGIKGQSINADQSQRELENRVDVGSQLSNAVQVAEPQTKTTESINRLLTTDVSNTIVIATETKMTTQSPPWPGTKNFTSSINSTTMDSEAPDQRSGRAMKPENTTTTEMTQTSSTSEPKSLIKTENPNQGSSSIDNYAKTTTESKWTTAEEPTVEGTGENITKSHEPSSTFATTGIPDLKIPEITEIPGSNERIITTGLNITPDKDRNLTDNYKAGREINVATSTTTIINQNDRTEQPPKEHNTPSRGQEETVETAGFDQESNPTDMPNYSTSTNSLRGEGIKRREGNDPSSDTGYNNIPQSESKPKKKKKKGWFERFVEVVKEYVKKINPFRNKGEEDPNSSTTTVHIQI